MTQGIIHVHGCNGLRWHKSILGCILQIDEGEVCCVVVRITKQTSYLVWFLLPLYTLENWCLDLFLFIYFLLFFRGGTQIEKFNGKGNTKYNQPEQANATRVEFKKWCSFEVYPSKWQMSYSESQLGFWTDV